METSSFSALSNEPYVYHKMLDFYLIKEEQRRPDYPAQAGLIYAGGLDKKTFSNLQHKGIIGAQFDFYSDFRLGADVVKQMQQRILEQQLQADSDIQQLLPLLDLAVMKRCGLMAYGD